MLQQPWHPQPQEEEPCWDPISACQAVGELPYFCWAGPAAPCTLNQSLCSFQVFFLLRYKLCVFSKGSWSENARLTTFTQAFQACSWPCWQLLDEAPCWHGTWVWLAYTLQLPAHLWATALLAAWVPHHHRSQHGIPILMATSEPFTSHPMAVQSPSRPLFSPSHFARAGVGTEGRLFSRWLSLFLPPPSPGRPNAWKVS